MKGWTHPGAWRLTSYIPGDKVHLRVSLGALVFACVSAERTEGRLLRVSTTKIRS